MQLFAKRGLVLAAATGTLAFSGLGAAYAGVNASSQSSNDHSVLSGTNLNVPVNVPVTVCGNPVAVLGLAHSGNCLSAVSGGSVHAGSTSHNEHSVLSGTNVNVPINAPITVCDNPVAVLGKASAGACTAGGSGSGGASAGSTSHNQQSIGSGTNLNVPVNAPVIVCGNPIAVLGLAKASDCATGAGGGAHAHSSSHNQESILSGSNINLPVNAPVVVCNNPVAVAGKAVAGNCGTGGSGGNGGTSAGSTSDNGGSIGSGTNGNTAVNTPVDVCGNPVAVLGKATTGDCNSVTPSPAPTPTGTPTGAPENPGTPGGSLAHTGGTVALWAAPIGAALVLAGVALYRRFRPQHTH